MTLHVYVSGSDGERIVAALDFELICFMAPAFEKFRSKTGVRISEYDDAVLHPDSVGLLLGYVREVKGVPDAYKSVLDCLVSCLEGASLSGEYVKFIGE